MKNKGFTLVELLAVIVILSLLAIITTVSIGNIMSSSKNSLSDEQKKNLEESAKIYYIKEGMSSNVNCIDLSDLISKGYIESSEVLDPKTKKPMTGSIKITFEANQYTYEYQSKTCE